MEFGILGPVEVRRDGRVVEVRGEKPRAVLAILLLHANEPVSAERLAVALWGEEAPTRAVRTIQVHVSRVRKALDDAGVLTTTPAGYRLGVRPGELDAERFEQLVAEGRAALVAQDPRHAAVILRQALGLWRGPALADLADEAFAQREIARLEEQRLDALEERIDADLACGRHREVAGELQELAATHPLRERLHGQLMLALYRSNRQADALAAYRHARALLAEELGLEPGAALRGLERAILNHDAALDLSVESASPNPTVGRERDFEQTAATLSTGAAGALGRSPLQPVRLPARAAGLLGREADTQAVIDLLGRDDVRLVTVTGVGGVGKTRLAIEVAHRLAGDLADGAAFVDLAPLADPAGAADTMLHALGSTAEPGATAIETLRCLVAAREQLLVLDNLEHILAAAPLLAELLDAAPRLKLLVTSRAALDLRAEHRYLLDPLALPDSREPAAVAAAPATALFIARTAARDPAFQLTAGAAEAIVTVCTRVHGLPLAIELAAARTATLSPQEIAHRLDRALTTLGPGARDTPERQRTLRATLDWSYELLGEPERVAFARLAAFAGGCTLDAASDVAGASLDLIDGLIAQSMLTRRAAANGETRLGMLEPVREYAAERLAALADRADVRTRHARWYHRLAESAAPDLGRAAHRHGLPVFQVEADNFRAAVAWAVASGDGEFALEIVCACGPWWVHTNQATEGRENVNAALALAGEAAPARLRAQALGLRARLWARTPGAMQRRRADLHAGLGLWRELGDTPRVIDCLISLSGTEALLGRRNVAMALADETLALARAIGDGALICRALAACAAAAPDHPDAPRRARASIPSLVRDGELGEAVNLLINVGYAALVDGRLHEALELFEEALPLADALGSPYGRFTVHGNLGLAHLFLDHDEAAAEALRRSLTAAREDVIEEIDEALFALAALAVRQGDLERAARLAGAGRAHVPAALNTFERRIDELLDADYLAVGRHRLGERRWHEIAAQAARLGLTEAIDLGLSAANRTATAPSNSGMHGVVR